MLVFLISLKCQGSPLRETVSTLQRCGTSINVSGSFVSKLQSQVWHDYLFGLRLVVSTEQRPEYLTRTQFTLMCIDRLVQVKTKPKEQQILQLHSGPGDPT